MPLEAAREILDRVGHTMASAEDVEVLKAAIPQARMQDMPLAHRAYVAIAEFYAFTDQTQQGDAWAAEGLTVASIEHAPEATLRLMFVQGVCSYASDDLVQGILLFTKGRASSYAEQHWDSALRFCIGVSMCVVLLGDARNALSILDDDHHLREHASPRILFAMDRARALAHIQLGRPDLAEKAMLAADTAAFSARDMAIYTLTLARAKFDYDQSDAAAELTDSIDYSALGLAWERCEYWLIRSELALQAQQHDAALEFSSKVLLEPHGGATRPLIARALRVRARALGAQGDTAGMYHAMDQSFEALRSATTGTVGGAVHAVVAPVLQEIDHLRSVELHSAHEALVKSVRQLTDANEQLANEAREHRRTKEELTQTHQELVRAAHFAGMAEVATGVLHDLGNALNSVGVSVNMAKRRVTNLNLAQLERVASGLVDGSIDGMAAAAYIDRVSAMHSEAIAELTQELDRSHNGLQHAARIIAAQQRNAAAPSGLEDTRLRSIIDDAVELALGAAPHIQTTIDVPHDEHLVTAPLRVVRILVNVLKNARDAMDCCPDPKISIRLAHTGDEGLALDIVDNGPGIPRQLRDTIFRHGFTTKTNGSGFGLHASATSAGELGGCLSLLETPLGHGAVFRLQLPRRAAGTRVDVLSTVT